MFNDIDSLEFYYEAPVSCFTCNEPIAARFDEFVELSKDKSSEEALNQMGIKNWCSRIAMLNPVKVFFDMENRKAIEGYVHVSMVNGPDNTRIVSRYSDFSPCIRESRGIKGTSIKSVEAIEPLEAIKPMGEAIDVDITNVKPLILPNIAGEVEINPDSTVEEIWINVGVGKKVKVLNGRTYLAI